MYDRHIIIVLNSILKSLGYHGIRCKESGEVRDSILPWENSMSYLIFNPEEIEIIGEESYEIVNGKLRKI